MNSSHDQFFNAISWTLVHSLWQGLVLAMLAGLVVLFTRKTSSAFRYRLLTLLFLGFCVGVAFTFRSELQQQDQAITSKQLMQADASADRIHTSNMSVGSVGELNGSDAIYYYLAGFLNHNSVWIVVAWFLVFSIKLVRMLNGFRQIQLIRAAGGDAPDSWQHELQRLKSALFIPQQIRLLESALVQVPSVAGFFKPVIILPIGLLANLPTEQVEAILLHELAHIRRKDYVINTLQHTAEMLFFFNPGLLWLSSLIREERENCCDDMAIAITQNKNKFVHALISSQSYQGEAVAPALGFSGRKTPLLDRAKRILHNKNNSLTGIEKLFLSLCIGALCTLAVACSDLNGQTVSPQTPAKTAQQPARSAKADKSNANQKTLTTHTTTHTETHTVTVISSGDSVMYYDGVLMKADSAQLEASVRDLAESRRQLEESKRQMEESKRQVEESKRQVEESKRQMAESRMQIDESKRQVEESKRQVEESKRQVAESKRMLAESQRQLAESKRQIELDKKRAQQSGCAPGGNTLVQPGSYYYKQVVPAEPSEPRPATPPTEVVPVKPANNATPKAPVNPPVPPKKSAPGVGLIDRSKLPVAPQWDEALLNDLYQQGIIGPKHLKNLSIKLTASEMIVSGVKQPAAIHNYFKQKYLKPNSSYYYNYELSSSQASASGASTAYASMYLHPVFLTLIDPHPLC